MDPNAILPKRRRSQFRPSCDMYSVCGRAFGANRLVEGVLAGNVSSAYIKYRRNLARKFATLATLQRYIFANLVARSSVAGVAVIRLTSRNRVSDPNKLP